MDTRWESIYGTACEAADHPVDGRYYEFRLEVMLTSGVRMLNRTYIPKDCTLEVYRAVLDSMVAGLEARAHRLGGVIV